jgi:hypothetical protein
MAHVTLLEESPVRRNAASHAQTDVMADNQKLSLQAFLSALTSKSFPISRAMTVASKMCCIYVLRVCIYQETK